MKASDEAIFRREITKMLEANVRVARSLAEGCTAAPCYQYEYANVEDFVLREGRWWKPRRLPARFRMRTLGHCFENAHTVAAQNPRTLRYCEGFASDGYNTPYHHAWNVDERGYVYDTTWPWGDANEPDNPKAYLGVTLPLKLIKAVVKMRGRYCVLDCPELDHLTLREPYSERRLWRRVQEEMKRRSAA